VVVRLALKWSTRTLMISSAGLETLNVKSGPADTGSHEHDQHLRPILRMHMEMKLKLLQNSPSILSPLLAICRQATR
jgi:hypothetical protein